MKPVRVVIPAVLLIALSAYLSLNVANEFSSAATAGQRIAASTQAAYIVLGLIAGVSALVQRRWLGTLLALWLLMITITAALAPVVWGGAPWPVGILSGLAGGVVGGLIAWWLHAASAPSLWEERSRRSLAARAARLTPELRAQWGRMTCPQMLTHVNDQLRMSMGEIAAKPKRVPVRYPPIKQLLVYSLPWPQGLPTSPELMTRIDASVWTAEVEAFEKLLAQFAARGPNESWPLHPAFGPLTRQGWGVLAYRHVDHHFRQFGV